MNWKWFLYPLLLPLFVLAMVTMFVGAVFVSIDTLVGKTFFWIID